MNKVYHSKGEGKKVYCKTFYDYSLNLKSKNKTGFRRAKQKKIREKYKDVREDKVKYFNAQK
jgi:peptidylprolyl isomerase